MRSAGWFVAVLIGAVSPVAAEVCSCIGHQVHQCCCCNVCATPESHQFVVWAGGWENCADCDRIEISTDPNCGTNFSLVTTLPCTATSYHNLSQTQSSYNIIVYASDDSILDNHQNPSYCCGGDTTNGDYRCPDGEDVPDPPCVLDRCDG